MRALFLFFVLANLAFYAWSTLLAPGESASDPRPLRAQIDPGKIRLLPPEPETARTPAPAPKPKPAAETAAAPVPGTCLEWGSFTLADAPNAERALEPLALGDRLSQRRTEETAGWWVYLPPQGNRQNAQKKAGELKGLGVTDMFIVADEGRWRWAISLGVFRSEDAAKAQMEALRTRGVRTAQFGERELQVPKIWLQARNPDPAQLARWRELALAFPGAEFRACAS